jgi:hypothetical protein
MPRRSPQLLVMTDAVGGLCNQLFRFAHVAAHAAATGATLAHPLFEHADAFPALRADPLCRFPARRPGAAAAPRWRRSLAHAATRVLALSPLPRLTADVGDLDLASDDARSRLAGRRLALLAGWGLRDPRALRQHADAVLDLLTLDDGHLQRGLAAVDAARAGCELVIGVHVRQGDYSHWQEGRHCYDDLQYAGLMRATQSAFAGQCVGFVVCASEPKAATAFGDVAVAMGPGDAYGDLAALMACDRILGPPSTFSAWASFAGGVPLAYVEDPAAPLTPASFAPWTAT